jgi:hypothetical protein
MFAILGRFQEAGLIAIATQSIVICAIERMSN